MFEQLSWTELLRRWSDELRQFAPDLLDALPSRGADRWVGAAPATAEQIAAAEARLGVTLPPSYREFLTITDGWPATGDFVTGIRPVGEVGWFRDLERSWFEIWRDIAVAEGLSDDDEDHALMGRALVVSTPGGDALLLDPARVDPASGEWFCCRFSNAAAGPSDASTSFKQGMERVHDRFVARRVDSGPSIEVVDDTVEAAFRRSLAGDLSAGAVFHEAAPMSWRAWALACQFDAFACGAGEYDWAMNIHYLWRGGLGSVSAEQALTDPVVLDELVPLWLVRLLDAKRSVDSDVHYAPPQVAERMRTHLAAIESGTGIVADFSYAPEFAAGVREARRLLAGDPDAAWRTILDHLPAWQPRAPHHLAPLGLRYDKDLRRLIDPPAARGPELLAVARGGRLAVS